MARLTQMLFVTTASGITAASVGAPHSGSLRLGLIGQAAHQVDYLGPLASSVAMEPALASASKHVIGFIVHANTTDTDSLNATALAAAQSQDLHAAAAHLKQQSEQAPRNPHPNWKGAPVDKNATVQVGANGAGFVGSGKAPKLKRAEVGVTPPQPPSLPEPPELPSVEDLTPEVPEMPKLPSIPDPRDALPDPPKDTLPEEWGQRKCFYLMILLLCFCGCFGLAAHHEHGLHVGSALAMTPAFFLLGYMCTQTNMMSRFWNGEQVGWWCAVLCFWATMQLFFGIAVLGAVGAGAVSSRKQQAAEMQGASPA